MITISLTPQDLERIRFAYSPLDELTMSYHMLRHVEVKPPLETWREDTTAALQGAEMPYMSALILEHSYMADFLTPTPTAAHREQSIDQQIADLRNLPNEVIRASVQRAIDHDGNTEIRQQYMIYPRELLECLIEELQLYWSRALAGHWSRIKVVLENDVLYRSREMALKGVEPLLSDLSEEMVYENGVLTVNKQGTWCASSHPGFPNGGGIAFSPSAFKRAGHRLSWQFVPEWDPMIIYGARGSGNWYNETMPDPEEQLRVALGDAPARLLVALSEPDHTSNLARRLYLTAGAVSQQLKRLNQAGLVESHRSGYKVYYRLSERGSKLINLFGA